jgi:hypothetical protein
MSLDQNAGPLARRNFCRPRGRGIVWDRRCSQDRWSR